MKKLIKLKESDLQRIVKRVLSEQQFYGDEVEGDGMDRLYGFSDETLINALVKTMNIRPYDLDRIEELKNLSREELVTKLTHLKGW
jgi:hypothetical protein